MVAKATSNGRSATPTTAIPNSGELAGDCGFAYPLLVYWNRSLSVPLFPSLSIYSKIIPSPSPFRLLSRPLAVVPPLTLSAPFILSRTPFVVLSSTQSSRPSAPASASASHCPPRLHLPSPRLSSSSLALYLPISISPLSAAQTLGHVHKAHRSPAFITRYEIAPRLRPGSPIPTSPRIRSPDGDAAPRRRDIHWQTLRMSDHAGLRISNNIAFSYTLAPRRGEIRSLLSRTVLSRRRSNMKSFFIR